MNNLIKETISNRLNLADNVLTHIIKYTYGHTEEDIQHLIYEYLKPAYEKDIIENFYLYKEIDDLTFLPTILIVMKLRNKNI